MSFSNVIGQAPTKQKLVELVQFNRLSHALLFLGNEGSGALPLALAFAQYNVCEKVIRPQTATAGNSLFGEAPPAGETQLLPTDACGV